MSLRALFVAATGTHSCARFRSSGHSHFALVLSAAQPAMAAEGDVTWAVHVSLAPTWFDPAGIRLKPRRP